MGLLEKAIAARETKPSHEGLLERAKRYHDGSQPVEKEILHIDDEKKN